MVPQLELPIPLTSRAVFWQPRHTGGEGSMLHQPFLFWLVETSRPTRIVQIGLAEPARFFSLCQAVEKLGMETLCMGVTAGEQEKALSGAQLEQHGTLYGDFSFVTGEDIARATRHVHGQGVDLLVIDTPLADEQIVALRTHWAPLLSERAVVVVHDPEKNLAGQEAKQYFEGLAQANSVISFSQTAPGLLVLLFGNKQPERLLRLADLELGMPGYLLARQVFARLGQGLESAQLARRMQDAAKKEKGSLKTLEQKISDLEDALKTEKAGRVAAEAAEQQQISMVAGLQATIFDLESKVREASSSAAPSEVDALRAEIEALKAAAAEEGQRRGKLQKTVKALEEEKAGLITERDRARAGRRQQEQLRLDEIAALQKSHADDLEALGADTAKQGQDREELEGRIAASEQEKADLAGRIDELVRAAEIAEQEKAGLVADWASRLESVQKAAEAQSAEIEVLRAAAAEEGQRRGKLQKTVKALEEEKATLTLERDRARSARRKEEQARVEETAALQTSHAEELKALKAAADQQAGQQDKVKADAAQAEKKREELTAVLEASEQEKLALAEAVEKLTAQLKQSQAKRLAIWEECQALKSQVTRGAPVASAAKDKATEEKNKG